MICEHIYEVKILRDLPEIQVQRETKHFLLIYLFSFIITVI